jgi:flagellar basal body P-ring protein FlgI
MFEPIESRRPTRSTRGAFTIFCRLSFVVATLLAGCAKGEWEQFAESFRHDAKKEQPLASPTGQGKTKAAEGTIGPLVTIEGLQLTEVRGYGLVVDLVDTGGRDGPEVVKKYIQKEVRRRQDIGMPGIPVANLFNDLDAAMVEVKGWIPAGAQKGDRFDVVIDALGSQTTSLVGGRLVLCDLKLYAETPSGIIEGKTLATASGPIFVSPFDREGRPTDKIDLRKQAWVLGGGLVKEPRRIRLTLNDPRYSIAQQIVTRINGRFGGVDPLADARSASFVDLKIPPEYKGRKRVFLEQVMHTTLNSNPVMLEKRAKDLVVEATHPDAEFETIALAWESIGRSVIPFIRDLYNHKLPETTYYAGRTGMRLLDNGGMEAVAKHARDPQSHYRMAAIEELGYAVTMYGAGQALKDLLDDPDEEVRIAAYIGLRRRPHPAVTRQVMDQDNLILDMVDSNGPHMIYVQRLDQPVIAVFGRQTRCAPPAIFPDPDRNDKRRLLTTIGAQTGSNHLTIVYKNKRTGQVSPQLKAPLDVGELVRFLADSRQMDGKEFVAGLSVPYSEVLDILQSFCGHGTIASRFVVEQGAGRPEGSSEEDRPESEY